MLVVDDDDFNFALFEFVVIDKLKLACDFAISGEQALEKVRIRIEQNKSGEI